MSKCARPDCLLPAKSSCSNCLREYYCSSICQKFDWKVHKSMCPILKKLSNKLQPFDEVVEILSTTLKPKKGEEIRFHQHILLYVEYQFGKEVLGVGYRERGDGSKIDNWTVEVLILYRTYFQLGESFRLLTPKNVGLGLGNTDTSKRSYHYYNKALSILEPWRIQMDLDEIKRTDSFDEMQINLIWEHLSNTERGLGYLHGVQEGIVHFSRAISYAKRLIIGEKRTELLFEALIAKGTSLGVLKNCKEAKEAREECYNLVAEFYSPDHPMVLEAGNKLIEHLLSTEEYYDAERFARISYECLTRPVDTESNMVADASESLATAMFRLNRNDKNWDSTEAEMLCRKALRIKNIVYGPNHVMQMRLLATLADILQIKGSHDTERRVLLEQSLAIGVGVNNLLCTKDLRGIKDLRGEATVPYYNLALYHHEMGCKLPSGALRAKELHIAESYCKTAIDSCTTANGLLHPQTITYKARLSMILDHLDD